MRAFLILLFILSFGPGCFAIENDTLTKKIPSRFLVFPFFLRSPETSWGFGGAAVYFFKTSYDDTRLRTSDVDVVALYTLHEQTLIVLGSTIYFPNEKKIFRFVTSYSHYPDKFWGVGNNISDDYKQDYDMRQFFINPQLMFKAYHKLYIGGSIELQNVSDFTYKSGGIFDEQNILGKNGSFTSGAGILFSFDSRNNAFSPDHGGFSEINFTHFDKIIGSNYNFTSITTDLRKFITIGKNRVLAMQSYMKFNIGETPIRNLAMLGGTEVMRGYYKGRYTDQDLIAVQAEVRQFLFWRLGVVGFAGAGQVSKEIQNFGIGEFHYSYGGGVRLMVSPKEKLNLRIDVGFGKQSSGIYVILKEAF